MTASLPANAAAIKAGFCKRLSSLEQDAEARRPRATADGALDALAACPPLTLAEQTRLTALQAQARAIAAVATGDPGEAALGLRSSCRR
jgi:hypothetical protein